MKKKRRMRRPVARSVRQIALKLSRTHTRDLGTTDPARRRLVDKTVEMLAVSLPAKGGRIYWEAFDVPGFFEQLSSYRGSHQERIALDLMGYYYWLCVQHLASASNVADILDGLLALFPESGTLAMLHHFSMIGLAGGIDAVLADLRSADDLRLAN